MDKKQQNNLIARFLWILKHRPRQLYPAGRGYVLFHLARMARILLPLEGVELSENVRLQKNSSLMAESPDATINIGANAIIYEDARIESYGNGKISIGPSSIVGDAHIVSRFNIQIGARFLTSWNVFIQDYDSHPNTPELRKQQIENMVSSFRPNFGAKHAIPLVRTAWDYPGEAIVIGDDVWLGAGTTILKGATIGSGSIVATGAVVLKGNYPALSLLAGNPAKVVKSLAVSQERQDNSERINYYNQGQIIEHSL